VAYSFCSVAICMLVRVSVHAHMCVCSRCYVCVYFLFFCACSEVLVRSGFQGLQLVVTDFLPSLPAMCLPVCVAVAGLYGVQNEDLNISLTSIGLLVCRSIVSSEE